jgi:hypothetical protein
MSRPRPWWLPHATLIPFVVLLIASTFSGCAVFDDETNDISTLKNSPPTIWLHGGPPEGEVAVYKIEFSWGGFDPDGEISHFEYCITDNDGAFDPADTVGADHWMQTAKTRDTFNFSADVPVDSVLDDPVEEFRRSHTFFIRSVDDQGTVSRETAYRSFTARTLSPDVIILKPWYVPGNVSIMPHVSTFEWQANDYIGDYSTRQDPDSVSWILEPLARHGDSWTETIDWIRDIPVDANEWGDWVPYGSRDGSGTSWTTPPINRGFYVFSIRAKDEAGAITPVFDETKNLRRVIVREINTGPVLTLKNPYFDWLLTATCTTPLSIAEIPAGVTIEFVFTADSGHYGGTVTGYRYGWDVANPDDPGSWPMDWIPFPPHAYNVPAQARAEPRTFFSGSHKFRLEVIDGYERISCLELEVNTVPVSMGKNLLLVDDFKEPAGSGWGNPAGKGFLPNDDEHDQFWLDVLGGVVGFDPNGDVIDVSDLGGELISLHHLLNYKSVIWSVYGQADVQGNYPRLHDLIQFRPKDDIAPAGDLWANPLALYMAAGGHVLIAGEHPVKMSINRNFAPSVRFPIVFEYELDVRRHGQDVVPDPNNPTGDESFPFRELCLETMEFAYVTSARLRDSRLTCPNASDRTLFNSLRDHSMRAAVPLYPGIPRLELRPETASPGKAHAADISGLDAEVYNPFYFADHCAFVSRWPRGCFEPIYGLECIDSTEPVYGEPVAFWTSAFIDARADVPGAISARSAVFGFAPVMFNPSESYLAIEHVVFDEWQLPRVP